MTGDTRRQEAGGNGRREQQYLSLCHRKSRGLGHKLQILARTSSALRAYLRALPVGALCMLGSAVYTELIGLSA
jgi:hypothetical protein